MFTVALRYAEKFAPEGGTVKAHQAVIDDKGYVWYGKIGQPLSKQTCSIVMENENPKIMLIHSGGTNRFWAYVDKIDNVCPVAGEYPEYYKELTCEMKTWFRITKFEDAPKNVMSTCKVKSSGASLSEVSRSSMSPFFVIECDD